MKGIAVGFSPEGQFKKKLTDKIHKGLKCFEIVGGEITGMSIVSNPASEMEVIFASDKERTISGVVLTPDKLIYRINPITGEQYYIYFTKEVINLLYQRYNEDKSWTDNERFKFVELIAEGKSVEEVALIFNRTITSVRNRMLKEGKPFIKMVIATMAQKGENLNSMAKNLDITVDELKKYIKEVGGRIYKK